MYSFVDGFIIGLGGCKLWEWILGGRTSLRCTCEGISCLWLLSVFSLLPKPIPTWAFCLALLSLPWCSASQWAHNDRDKRARITTPEATCAPAPSTTSSYSQWGKQIKWHYCLWQLKADWRRKLLLERTCTTQGLQCPYGRTQRARSYERGALAGLARESVPWRCGGARKAALSRLQTSKANPAGKGDLGMGICSQWSQQGSLTFCLGPFRGQVSHNHSR